LVGLENLGHLNISANYSLKEIPKGIEGLVNLKVLDLSFNDSLKGSFPSGVLERLSHLQSLNLIRSVQVEPEALVGLEKLEILKVDFYNF
ncbi:hypothetical protein J0J30_23555, partial [Vibrio vulnificus]|nr:hypothetical protein [Vibrio vulnificus]